MKQLFNYASIPEYENELLQMGMSLQDFVKSVGVDGIEQFVYTTESPVKSYADISFGVHLLYWPTFMDFWLRKTKRLRSSFRNINERSEYYNDAMGREEWLGVIRKNIVAAVLENPKYLVWHVSEANHEEIYTWQFNYSDREVCLTSAEIFNMVADEIPETVTVLFENLWWPGLRLTDPKIVKFFFEHINHKNVGIMLDTGHLMNTNLRLTNEQEAADYICKTVDKLGEHAGLIKGVHLNCTLCGDYMRSTNYKLVNNPTLEQVYQHICKIDESRPFTTDAVKQILKMINPEYVNHEFNYHNLSDLRTKLAQQMEHL
ncbi:MAG: TIM barrel protein [Acidaminococcaceae bacterium]|nr:TIM barrel protein [Acidaminococcaceae bacterium]